MSETNQSIELKSPWYTYRQQLFEVFKNDSKVEIGEITEGASSTRHVKVTCKSFTKYEALNRVLKKSVSYGNVTLYIDVVCDYEEPSIAEYMDNAFSGTKYYVETVVDPLVPAPNTYSIFKPEVIQFFNDDASDYYNNYNEIVKDVIREIIDYENVPVNISTAKTISNSKAH